MNNYMITMKNNGRKIHAGTVSGDRLKIEESKSSVRIKYINIYLNNIMTYSNTIVGSIEVVEKDKENKVFEIRIDLV